jgi:hypothetical protein
VRLILECGAACWDPFREAQVNALDRVHMKVAKFANLLNDSNWLMAQHREIAHICAVYKVYSRELSWKAVGDRLQRPYYLSRANHVWKIWNRRQKMDIGKCSFVNRTTQLWNKLPVNALGNFPFKPGTFKKRVRKVK